MKADLPHIPWREHPPPSPAVDTATVDCMADSRSHGSLPADFTTTSTRPRHKTSMEELAAGMGSGNENAADEKEVNFVRRAGGPGRKPRACVECKRQKMKCEFFPGDQKCRNCQRRGIEVCTFRRVMLPPEGEIDLEPHKIQRYEAKIDSMRSEIQQMRASIEKLVQQTTPAAQAASMTPLQPAHESPQQQRHVAIATPVDPPTRSSREDNMAMAMTRENSLEPVSDIIDQNGGGAVTVEDPMGSLYEVTRLRNIRSNKAKTARQAAQGEQLSDFISRGVISLSEAEELYKCFHTTLNHYLWVGLEQTHSSFASVRQSSELLTATILAVTALHIPTSAETFDTCYKEFLSLISSSMFSRYHSIDDVRALCIAAFWLSEVSWKLSGHAIRIATELNIHQSFTRALEGDKQHFLRARLWYMLYVCDHHFSIAYGRPPMIAESLQIREHELFLQSPYADALDRRILSQVALMQVMTRIYDRFAGRRLPNIQQLQSQGIYHQNQASQSEDHDQDPAGAMLADGDLADLRGFNLEIDQWRMRWHARQERNRFIGTFPPKGIILYSYFAKLQLNSLAIRGVSLSQGRLSTERKEFANMAISAAASILTFVLEEDDMRRALVGTPLYVHTMIAFAAVFLMKVATKWNRIMGLNVEPNYVAHLLERVVALLKTSVTSDRHLLYHIASGLEKMLAKLVLRNSKSSNSTSNRPLPDEVGSGTLAASGISPGQDSVVSFGPMGYNSGIDGQLITLEHHHATPDVSAAALLVTTEGVPWNSYAGPTDDIGNRRNHFLDDAAIMNDSLLYEVFGSDSTANDVYNLLSSQFSH